MVSLTSPALLSHGGCARSGEEEEEGREERVGTVEREDTKQEEVGEGERGGTEGRVQERGLTARRGVALTYLCRVLRAQHPSWGRLEPPTPSLRFLVPVVVGGMPTLCTLSLRALPACQPASQPADANQLA